MREWRIIDFRRKAPKSSSLHANMVFAVYNDNFTEYTVHTTAGVKTIAAITAETLQRNSSILRRAAEPTPPSMPVKP
jgi:hypothetical protein